MAQILDKTRIHAARVRSKIHRRAAPFLICVPTEVVKQRMQTGQFTSALNDFQIGYKLAAKRELNDPENAIIGAFAGTITGALTTPLDVMKIRLMVQGSANQYNGLLSCAQTIMREEGPTVFLKGIGPRVLWIGIEDLIFFGVLERIKLLLSEQRATNGSESEASKQE